jgi:hypothetical protein
MITEPQTGIAKRPKGTRPYPTPTRHHNGWEQQPSTRYQDLTTPPGLLNRYINTQKEGENKTKSLILKTLKGRALEVTKILTNITTLPAVNGKLVWYKTDLCERTNQEVIALALQRKFNNIDQVMKIETPNNRLTLLIGIAEQKPEHYFWNNIIIKGRNWSLQKCESPMTFIEDHLIIANNISTEEDIENLSQEIAKIKNSYQKNVKYLQRTNENQILGSTALITDSTYTRDWLLKTGSIRIGNKRISFFKSRDEYSKKRTSNPSFLITPLPKITYTNGTIDAMINIVCPGAINWFAQKEGILIFANKRNHKIIYSPEGISHGILEIEGKSNCKDCGGEILINHGCTQQQTNCELQFQHQGEIISFSTTKIINPIENIIGTNFKRDTNNEEISKKIEEILKITHAIEKRQNQTPATRENSTQETHVTETREELYKWKRNYEAAEKEKQKISTDSEEKIRLLKEQVDYLRNQKNHRIQQENVDILNQENVNHLQETISFQLELINQEKEENGKLKSYCELLQNELTKYKTDTDALENQITDLHLENLTLKEKENKVDNSREVEIHQLKARIRQQELDIETEKLKTSEKEGNLRRIKKENITLQKIIGTLKENSQLQLKETNDAHLSTLNAVVQHASVTEQKRMEAEIRAKRIADSANETIGELVVEKEAAINKAWTENMRAEAATNERNLICSAASALVTNANNTKEIIAAAMQQATQPVTRYNLRNRDYLKTIKEKEQQRELEFIEATQEIQCYQDPQDFQ